MIVNNSQEKTKNQAMKEICKYESNNKWKTVKSKIINKMNENIWQNGNKRKAMKIINEKIMKNM